MKENEFIKSLFEYSDYSLALIIIQNYLNENPSNLTITFSQEFQKQCDEKCLQIQNQINQLAGRNVVQIITQTTLKQYFTLKFLLQKTQDHISNLLSETKNYPDIKITEKTSFKENKSVYFVNNYESILGSSENSKTIFLNKDHQKVQEEKLMIEKEYSDYQVILQSKFSIF
jgi:hypothetical protein